MRKLCRVLMALPLMCLYVGVSLAQNTQATNQQGITNFFQQRANFETSKSGDKYYVLLTFSHIPGKNTLAQLKSQQIQLLELRSKNTYLAAIPDNINQQLLENFSVIKIQNIDQEQKLSEPLLNEIYPDWAIQEAGQVDIAIVFHEKTALNQIQLVLNQFNVQVLEDKHRGNTTIVGRVNQGAIKDLANSPLVAFIDAIQEPVSILNHESCVNQRVNVLNSNVPGAYGLLGSGVTIGVGDGGELGEHLDFGNRIINEASGTYSSFGNHGDHVAGIIGGAGNLNPRHRGMAPECEMVIQKTSMVTYNTSNYFNDYEMVLTNNSYGTSFNCITNGSYNYSAQNLDWQMREFPEVLHVYAAGNSGGGTCEPYPQGYKTVLRYYQSAKNVLTVGNVDENRKIVSSSSRGPVLDGRLKPEICGIGKNVYSTGREFDYTLKGGTSMAAPSVTGTLALLVEKYRLENDGNNPEGGLLKAIACNTSEDLGTPGPDYIHGFGLINGRRAADVIENENYFSNTIYDGDNHIETLNIPAGTKQVKLMLYWHDKEATVYPDKALVNDLDIQLISPDGTSYHPWILNIDPEHVADPATRGIDTLNNIEQITIDNPQAGNYTILVNGSNVPFGDQKYFVTYETISEDIILTFPYGGESLSPGTTEFIQWDTDPTNTATFKIEYSIDGGNIWLLLAPAVEANKRSWSWTVPMVNSDLAIVRVSKNGEAIEGESTTYFNILETPAEFLAYASCSGTIQLEWESVDYAVAYEIMIYSEDEGLMIPLTTTTETSYLVTNISDYGDRHWFSIRAKNDNENYCSRLTAKFCIPEDVLVCPWEDDPVLYAITTSVRGREKTNLGLTSDEVVQVEVKNVGMNNISNFNIFYSINGETPIQEIFTNTIESGDSMVYDFTTKVDFSQGAIYNIDSWVAFDSDTHNFNDSLLGQHTVVQLQNDPIMLPFVEEFSQVKNSVYQSNLIGLKGAERWDFETNGLGKLETKASDRNLLLVPASLTGQTADLANNAILTVNLSNYKTVKDDILLDFKYESIPVISAHPAEGETFFNRVEVRGNDSQEWLPLYILNNKVQDWENVEGLNITKLLDENGQSLSSSFQIRFAQNNNYAIRIDDIRLELDSPFEEALTDFTAEQVGINVVLNWKTPNNLITEFFDIQVADNIEDSINGNFKTIGSIEGIGTTTQPRFYSFNDTRPGKKGEMFYRLKQIDADGNFSFSPVLVVDYDLEENTNPNFVYPNPFTTQLNIQYQSDTETEVIFALFNNKGQILDQLITNVSVEDQRIPFALSSEIPTGVYFLKIINGQETICHKVIKE